MNNHARKLIIFKENLEREMLTYLLVELSYHIIYCWRVSSYTKESDRKDLRVTKFKWLIYVQGFSQFTAFPFPVPSDWLKEIYRIDSYWLALDSPWRPGVRGGIILNIFRFFLEYPVCLIIANFTHKSSLSYNILLQYCNGIWAGRSNLIFNANPVALSILA